MKLKELYEMKNHMGETEYNSYKSWKAACKKHYPDFKVEGDEDIAQAMVDSKSVGEWDGAVGVLFDNGPKKIKEDTAAVKFTPPYRASADTSAGAQGTWCIKDSKGAVVRCGMPQQAATEEVQNMNTQEKPSVPGTSAS